MVDPSGPRSGKRPTHGTAPSPTEHPAAGAHSLDATRRDAFECKACPLWKDATRTVFGEGKVRAAIMFVGEQPGDSEERAGFEGRHALRESVNKGDLPA